MIILPLVLVNLTNIIGTMLVRLYRVTLYYVNYFLRAMLYSAFGVAKVPWQVTLIWNNNHSRLIASHHVDIMYSQFRCAA